MWLSQERGLKKCNCNRIKRFAELPMNYTWVRYLIEGAGDVFTRSRYKDLQIQMYGELSN